MFKNKLLITIPLCIILGYSSLFSAETLMAVDDSASHAVSFYSQVPSYKRDIPFNYETAIPHAIVMHHSFYLSNAPLHKLLSIEDLRRIGYGFTLGEQDTRELRIHHFYPIFNIRGVSRWDSDRAHSYDWKNYSDTRLRRIIDKGDGNNYHRMAAFNHLTNWLYIHQLNSTEACLNKVMFLAKLTLWDAPACRNGEGSDVINVLERVMNDDRAPESYNYLDRIDWYINYCLKNISIIVPDRVRQSRMRGTLKAHLTRSQWFQLLDEKADQSWDLIDPECNKRRQIFAGYNDAFKKKPSKICLLEMMRLIHNHELKLGLERSDEQVLFDIATRYRAMNKESQNKKISKRKKAEMDKGHVPLPARDDIDFVDDILSAVPSILEDYDSDDSFIDNMPIETSASGEMIATFVESDLDDEEDVVIKRSRRSAKSNIFLEDDDVDGTCDEAFRSSRFLATSRLGVDTSSSSVKYRSRSRSSYTYEGASLFYFSPVKSLFRAKRIEEERPRRLNLTWNEQVKICQLFDQGMSKSDVVDSIQKDRNSSNDSYQKLLSDVQAFKGQYYLVIKDTVKGTDLESHPVGTDHLTEEDKLEIVRLHQEDEMVKWKIAGNYKISYAAVNYYINKSKDMNSYLAVELTESLKAKIRTRFAQGMKICAIADDLKMQMEQVRNYTRRYCPFRDAGDAYTGEVTQLTEEQKEEVRRLCDTVTERELAVQYNTVISVILAAKNETPHHAKSRKQERKKRKE